MTLDGARVWFACRGSSRSIQNSGEAVRELAVAGLEADGADLFYYGGGASGKLRAVRRPEVNLEQALE